MTTYSWSLEKGVYASFQIVSGISLGGRPPSLSRFGLMLTLSRRRSGA